jgi:glycosyltransferase involved in cell wall biosynthesis
VPTIAEDTTVHSSSAARPPELEVALLTGGIDRPYAYGLAMALVRKGVRLEVIGSDQIDSPEMHTTAGLRFLNLWPSHTTHPTAVTKLIRVAKYYARLLRYTAMADPAVFHVLWNGKIQLFDRTLLMLFYKAMGKEIALTAHNVNQGRRDGNDSLMNRLTLRMQYRLTDHIFVHTQKMKDELVADFAVQARKVTVIRHPINDAFPDTRLTPEEAKRQLGLRNSDKTILCFGRIKPYKGIEHLLAAFQKLAKHDACYRLIVAGEVQKGNERYLSQIKRMIPLELDRGQIILKTQFIPDEDMELYLKAADAMVLPYNEIFQSGVLFLGYSFGLPVIATDVGSFKEEIVEGRTGFLCRPGDPTDLARAIQSYFGSDLYKALNKTRKEIKHHANIHHSWGAVAELTRNAYATLAR